MPNLLNMDKKSEMYEALLNAFRGLERGTPSMDFRNRKIEVKKNRRGRRYLELPGYLTVKFRVYEPQDSKSVVMAIVTDLWRPEEVDGRQVSDNPVFWGRVQRGRGDKENLFFFHDNGRTERAEPPVVVMEGA